MSHGELCRVIIVDDELLIRQGIKHYIEWEQEGFEIVGEASNGQEAMELIRTKAPHIIITDIVMPVMDGEELTRVVRKEFPQIQVIILSSFGEFDYVRSTFQHGVVDYILKPKLDGEILLDALKKAVTRIPHFQLVKQGEDPELTIEDCITKLITGEQNIQMLDILNQAFSHDYFYLMGMHYNNQASIDMTIKQQQIEKVLLQHLNNKLVSIFRPQKDMLVILINLDKEEDNILMEAARKLAESLSEVTIVITGFKGIDNLVNAYKVDLMKLLKYTFYFSEEALLTFDKLPKPLPTCKGFDLDSFISEFKREQFDSSFTYLEEHISSFSFCYTKDVYEFKSFFNNIIFNITILLSNMDYDIQQLDKAKYTYFKSIDEARTAKEVLQQWDHFLLEVKQLLATGKNQARNPNMKKLMQYITDHYAEPITLTEVAKHFHFNPSYLSNYFATHNKESFIEYLNRIRIEEASRLLVKKSAAISEVGSKVGYSDHSYFCKVFKKVKGMSPSQYRRTQQLNKR
ncbi:response regulator [Evansella sp. AB-rgal1]|uniref:response regulator transcription factor n=1 Tax=Evansella sp. AB-rgal1 TaxID=3242696 RepID=UPI00359DD06F